MLSNSVIGMGWEDLGDLSQFPSRDAMKAQYRTVYPTDGDGRVSVAVGQLWAFSHVIAAGDTVVVPLKTTSQIAVGVVSGPYRFSQDYGLDMRQMLPVSWIRTDVPRTDFDQDLLYSFGAFMTVCTVRRDNAERRVLAVVNRAAPQRIAQPDLNGAPSTEDAAPDLEQAGRDAILSFIRQRFKGHGLAQIVEGVLRAQGLKTHLSPPGPDGGVDIVAGGGALGLDPPQLVVQVKSSDSSAGTDVLLALKGAMANYGASQGLLVCWGGFKDTTRRDARNDYFKVRLWDQADLITAVFASYEKLEEDLRAQLPLKRVWALATEAEAE